MALEDETVNQSADSGELASTAGSGQPGSRWRRPSAARLIIAAAVLAVIVPTGIWAWHYFTSYVSTEDAQVDGHLVFINSRINGTILHVYVDDTAWVKKGQLLADIDRRDYKVVVEQAEADLSQAKALVKSAQADVQTAQAKIGEDEANYAKAARDVPRLKALSQRGAAPREDYYESLRQERVYDATTAADRATLNAALRNVAYRQAVVAAKQAALDQAQLNLSYTKIFAPIAGVVGNRTVQVGQRVAPGQGLMVITPDNMWVTANFKETYFGQIRPGQPATIHVDALGRDLPGYVEGLGGASGVLYSLLPPENATGNWVKVVQRLPVRIRFDQRGDDPPEHLRPGESVEVKVWLR